jgi:hypothetical protein
LAKGKCEGAACLCIVGIKKADIVQDSLKFIGTAADQAIVDQDKDIFQRSLILQYEVRWQSLKHDIHQPFLVLDNLKIGAVAEFNPWRN